MTTHNRRINRLVTATDVDTLRRLHQVSVGIVNLSRHEHETWVCEYLPDHKFPSDLFKKPIEFFATWKLLAPKPDHVILDAAGGVYTYLHRIPASMKILQDLKIPEQLKEELGPEILYLESDAGKIPLPDGSVDRICCHHSFEHFEGDADTRFILEVQRLLAPRGRACILPLFVADRYFELTNRLKLSKKFDVASRRVIDLSATLPGGNSYARIYDLDALQRRVLRHINRSAFRVSILEIRMDGRAVPNLDLAANAQVAHVNRPFRALVIDRIS